ncbi:MAG: SgcJ/EcaC family oxidoreductase [Candidatus Acidiferrales bacterium]
MKISRVVAVMFPLATIAGLIASCAQKPAANPQPNAAAEQAAQAQDETAIRGLDTSWAGMASAKDPDQFAAFYAPDATLMAPGAPVAAGKDAVRKMWANLMGTPGFTMSFTPSRIQVSKSGDLAYEIGQYQLTLTDANGSPQTVNAMYVVVWGKQADGTWKVEADAPTTSQASAQ